MSGFFDYFQISALIVFSCLAAGRALQLRWNRKINALVFVRNKGKHNLLTRFLVILIIHWVAVLVLHVTNHDIHFLSFTSFISKTNVLDLMPAKIAGVVLIILGLTIYALAWVTLGKYWRAGSTGSKDGELVTRGIYAFTRNPIYTFFALYFIATFLINGTLVFLIFTILVVLNVHYLVLEEEKVLLKTHGARFRQYCMVTGRYLSWRKIMRNSALAGRG